MDADAALNMVKRLYARIASRRPEFDRREDYYNGKQPLTFATEEWRKANAARYSGFSDNWVRPVIDAEAERIRHTGIKIGDSTGAADKLWRAGWLENEMEMQSSQGFVSTLTNSRSYVIVWGDENGDPTISWEHGSNVEIEYDWSNYRNAIGAVKTWADDKFEYATLYEPEAVWKFQRDRYSAANANRSQAQQAKVIGADTAGWAPRLVRGESWPVVNPIGEVPVVEMPNRPILAGDPISEISGVIPMQDAINLLWAYLFLAADYASMDARVIMGASPPMIPILDQNGQRVGERPAQMKDLQEKRFMYISDKDAKIDSWTAAKLDQFTGVIDKAVGHIAAQTRTPPTYLVTTIGMSNVSADGLKASEVGLVKKTLEFQTFATPALRKMYRLVALVMNDKALAKQTKLATISWMNPEIRSESQMADALLKKKQLGYPLEYLMELDGLDPIEVDRVLAMAEQEQVDPQIDRAARELNRIGDTSSSGNILPGAATDSGADGSGS